MHYAGVSCGPLLNSNSDINASSFHAVSILPPPCGFLGSTAHALALASNQYGHRSNSAVFNMCMIVIHLTCLFKPRFLIMSSCGNSEPAAEVAAASGCDASDTSTMNMSLQLGCHETEIAGCNVSYVVAGAPCEDADLAVFAVHGAGQSKETFLPLFEWLGKQNIFLVAFDLRGHGATSTLDGVNSLSVDVLAQDTMLFVSMVLGEATSHRQLTQKLPWALLGHSVGGCVAIATSQLFVAATTSDCGVDSCGQNTAAGPHEVPASLVLLDCATECVATSLKHLEHYLTSVRPLNFESIDAAVKWHMDRGIYTSSIVARASLSAVLVDDHDGPGCQPLTWRTCLTDYKDDWPTWASGMSEVFVSLPAEVRKVLVMSSHELMDVPLNIAEMQGSIAVEVIQAGHQLHENASDKVALCIVRMWQKLGVLPKYPAQLQTTT